MTNDKLKKHLNKGSKFFIASGIVAVTCYTLGVFIVDYLKVSYSIFGLAVVPYSFTLRYLLNHYWVWKK